MTFTEIIYSFEDNWVWSCKGNFSQLYQEYMWSAVKVSKNGPMVSEAIKRHDTQLNLFDINANLA